MTKKAKIEQLLQKANQQFAGLDIAKEKIESELWQKISLAKEDISGSKIDIGKEFLKLKLLRLTTIGLSSIIILVLLGSGIIYAADFATPGDWLYSVDRKIEEAQLSLIKDPDKKSDLEIKFLEERKQEVEKLKQADNQPEDLLKQEELLNEMDEKYKHNKNEIEAVLKKEKEMVEKKSEIIEEKLDKLEKINNFIKKESALIKNRNKNK